MTHEQLQIEEIANEDSNIGYYGFQWYEFMERCHPKLFKQLEKKGTIYAVARGVDKRAWEYKKLLDRQYEQAHERPPEYMGEDELRSWTFTRNFYTDGAVMREKVLIPYREL